MQVSIKAVFFDAGNTLLKPHPSVEEVCRDLLLLRGHDIPLEDISRALDLSDQYYEDVYWKDDTFWASEDRTAEVWTEMYALAMRHLGLPDAEGLGRLLYEEFGRGDRWALYPDVMPTVELLHSRGILMGIISNWDVRLPGLCHHLGISRYLEFVISSANLGRIKPEHSIFRMALERVGVRPEEAMHVGDHYYADVMGARSAGLHPVLIDRFGRAGETCAIIDFPVIRSLEELPPLVFGDG
ncbi:MAG: HAD family hydrolase [Candidatus Geothermincolales bacterium]